MNDDDVWNAFRRAAGVFGGFAPRALPKRHPGAPKAVIEAVRQANDAANDAAGEGPDPHQIKYDRRPCCIPTLEDRTEHRFTYGGGRTYARMVIRERPDGGGSTWVEVGVYGGVVFTDAASLRSAADSLERRQAAIAEALAHRCPHCQQPIEVDTLATPSPDGTPETSLPDVGVL